MTANTHKNTLLQVAQGNALTKTCKRVFLFPTQEKLKNKKFPSLQKNKTLHTHNPRQTSIFNVCSLTTTDSATTERRRASANKGLPKAGVTGFYNTFVLNRTFVFQINSSAVTPRLRQAPKR
jgi:hypothetical protein